MKNVIAIGPGASGGIAFQRDGQPAEAVPMPPTEGDVLDCLRQLAADPANTVAFVEEVIGYIGKAQPGSPAFTFGRGFGYTPGVLQTLGVRFELVRPQRWQKTLGLGTVSGCASNAEWKNRLKAHAQRLYRRPATDPQDRRRDPAAGLRPEKFSRAAGGMSARNGW